MNAITNLVVGIFFLIGGLLVAFVLGYRLWYLEDYGEAIAFFVVFGIMSLCGLLLMLYALFLQPLSGSNGNGGNMDNGKK